MYPYVMRAWRHVRSVFGRTPWWAELSSAITATLWAVISIASPDPMAAWPSMALLLSLLPARVWEGGALLLGTTQMLFLIIDHRWLRWIGAVTMCWFWALLTLGVGYATPWAPATAVYAGWAIINMASILRLLRWHV